MMDTMKENVLDRIRSSGRGAVFTPKDFLDIGSRDAADQALSRLTHNGKLQRLARGLYHYPQMNRRLRIPLAPNIDAIADALGRQTGSRVIPSGAVAANRLGLSSQVPAKPIYLSDGRSRKVRVGNIEFWLKHASPKEMPAGNRTSALVFQALRYLGKDAVDDQIVATLRRALSAPQRRELLSDAKYTTDWIGDVARLIAARRTREAAVTHG
jgi:hypothetical protein